MPGAVKAVRLSGACFAELKCLCQCTRLLSCAFGPTLIKTK